MRRIYRSVSWRRNIRKVPPAVRVKLTEQPENHFIVGAVKTVTKDEMDEGVYDHLGLSWPGDAPVASSQRVPDEDMGRYSFKNRHGWEVVLRHEPKVYKTFTFETPNFGDPSKGYHTVVQERLVYQRDEIPAPELAITADLLIAKGDSAIYRFAVGAPVDPRASDFEDELKFSLNLLQENIGICDVLDPAASIEELIETQLVEWEIFPAGTSPEQAARIAISRMPRRTAEQEEIIFDRHKLFASLGPRNFIRGTGGMHGYVGALFDNDLVVFENVRHGNALYVLYEDWQGLSQQSRNELLRSDTAHFTRFPHRPGWENRFTAHLRQEKSARGLGGPNR